MRSQQQCRFFLMPVRCVAWPVIYRRNMENFILIEKDIDVTAIAAELQRNEAAWLADVSRQKKTHCQRETESIFLRAAKKTDPTQAVADIQETRDCLLSPQFPATMGWLAGVAVSQRGELGRALFAKLQPHGRVYPHIDHGSYYALRHRFHLVMKSQGSLMHCDGEEVVMQEGELWEFNNKKRHEASNTSSESRIHLIFDLLLDDALL